jgi:glucose/arabinose dehydrogenase
MRTFLFTLIILVHCIVLQSQKGINIVKWLGGVSVPVDIGNCGDDRVFIVEKTGKIRIVKNAVLVTAPFLDIVSKVKSSGGEQGLLGIAFHPDYKNNGYFYVNYTNRGTPTLTVIERYKVSANPDKADTAGQILLTYAQPYTNHNGGCLKFGFDGFLYIGSGDGGSANDPQNNAQNKKSYLGKMLRIDVNAANGYKIPASNPFINDSTYLKEIWAVGLRNPWRYSFDRLTGDLWIGDVGQDSWEEVDFEAVNSVGGKNYGWRCYEGNHNFNLTGCAARTEFTFPLHEYASDQNTLGCSVTGGYVYRGDKYPSLYGKYIYCDYCSGKFWALKRNADGTYVNTEVYDYNENSITTFGEDLEGNIYFADAVTSSIYKITDTCTFNYSIISTDPSCPGINNGSAKTNLDNSMNAKFIWSTGDTSRELNNLPAGNYSVKVYFNQCLTEKSFTLNAGVTDSACINNAATAEICMNDSLLLVACDDSGSEYNWYRNGNKINTTDASLLYVKDPGSYQLIYKDSAGCQTIISSEINVVVNPLPATPVLNLQRDTLFTAANYSLYRWYLNGNLIGSTQENYWIARNEGNYQVEVIDSNQCSSILSNPLHVIPVGNVNISKNSNLFSIIPNPAHDFIMLQINRGINPMEWNYRIYTIEDKAATADKKVYMNGTHRIDISELPKGIYLIRLTAAHKEENLWFVRQ